MKYPVLWCLGLVLAIVTMIGCDKDDDEEKKFYTKNGLVLSGDQENPAKTTPGSGTMNVTYDKTTKVLVLSISWSNLTADPVGAHIHGTAPRGMNAGVKVDFSDDVTTATGGLNGQLTVDGNAIKEDSLLAGFYYFNIHTPENPGGEIRGQIEF